ncbi:MAG: hypothetical protein DRQ89_12325 [Epsilonproteobacteria bacterium]|nr:MAG: hypothetical protein DRQ89_12325 [Campylobacterota bacterium]
MQIENDGDNGSATPERGMQDIADDIESRLYGSDEEPADTDGDEVSDDAIVKDALPDDDDSDSDEDDGSDLEDIATDEELSLADYLGIDEDKLIVGEDGSVSFNAIIDGESQEVSLKELATSYQMQGHVNNKSMALETDRREFEEARGKVATELKSRIDGVEALHNMAEEQLVGEYNNIDWDKLRYENPSEWSALRQEYAEKAQKIKQAQGLVSEERERISNEQQKEFHEKMSEHMKGELGKMIGKNPTWADDAVRKTDMEKMKDFMVATYGYEPEAMDTISDHRLIEVIKDAKAFRESTKAALKKKVKKLPKFQKPGAARGNAASLAKARAAKANKAALRKDGSTQSVANSILDRM